MVLNTETEVKLKSVFFLLCTSGAAELKATPAAQSQTLILSVFSPQG